MPRFYFNVGLESPDRVGVVLPDRHSVRGEAIRSAGEMLRDLGGLLDGPEWSMTVNNEIGEFVLKLSFSVIEPAAK
jgi:hypothetical protein